MSRRDYGPADLGRLQAEASVKLPTLTAFVICLKKKSMWHFRWYLHDSEAVNSLFYWVPSSNCSARVSDMLFFGLSTWKPIQHTSHNETTYASPVCVPCTATTSHIGSINTPPMRRQAHHFMQVKKVRQSVQGPLM